MSMPKLPEIDTELTSCHALNMIISSIAVEELALGHIIEAEGEKLRHVLKTLKLSCDPNAIGEILSVNQSITCLLDSVAQNQMILKSKMEKAVNALEKLCPPPCPPQPPCPPPYPPCPPQPYVDCHKCSAVFKADRCQTWCSGSSLQWSPSHISGQCARLDSCDRTKINLNCDGRCMVSFAVNIRAECDTSAAISLQQISNHLRTPVYTVYGSAEREKPTTISMSGIIVECGCNGLSSLVLKLSSEEAVIIEDSMLSIVEI